MANTEIGGPYLNGDAQHEKLCVTDLLPLFNSAHWESDFKHMTTLTPAEFLKTLEGWGQKYDGKLEKVLDKLDEVKDEFAEMVLAATKVTVANEEWVRKVKDHEILIHGMPGQSEKGLDKRMERVEATLVVMEKKHAITRSRTWDVFSGVFVAIAVLAIAHYLGLKP